MIPEFEVNQAVKPVISAVMRSTLTRNTMEKQFFTKEGLWDGGYYELALEIGEASDDKLQKALLAIWQHPKLTGGYLQRDKEPIEQQKADISIISLETGSHLQGLARLPNNYKIACGTCLIREDEGPDWLDFYLPMGSLAEAYQVGAYPFDENENSPKLWQKEVDGWLAEIGNFIYSKVRYKLGLIGFEVSGEFYSSQFDKNEIPEKRYEGFLWPTENKLNYFAKNK